MKIVLIVQARMTSTRLPGKILKEMLGKPLLGYQVEQLRRVRQADALWIATTDAEQGNPQTSQPIVDFCEQWGVPYVRGSETDVLSRYHQAAQAAQADVVVRLTSDCPIIDPAVVDRVIEAYRADPQAYDYVSNTLERTYPRGMDTEVFSFAALETAHREAMLPHEREHVTPFFYTQPERFRLGNVAHPVDESQHRWTVDTPEDFALISRIIEALYPEKQSFAMQDVLTLLAQHPDWTELNAHVEQKKLLE